MKKCKNIESGSCKNSLSSSEELSYDLNYLANKFNVSKSSILRYGLLLAAARLDTITDQKKGQRKIGFN